MNKYYDQTARANHETCPLCGMWHTSMSCAPQFIQQSLKIEALLDEVFALREIINRALKLTNHSIPYHAYAETDSGYDLNGIISEIQETLYEKNEVRENGKTVLYNQF